MDYSVVYECVNEEAHYGCGKRFIIHPNDDFDHEPSTRHCPFCNNKGLAYRGPKDRQTPYVQSDNIGGVQGLQSMADGKYYDSKSSYYASLKEQGLTIVGDDVPTSRAQPKTEEIDWGQAVAETMQQLKH